MAYVPTIYENNNPPSLNYSNLNKSEEGIRVASENSDKSLSRIDDIIKNESIVLWEVGNINENGQERTSTTVLRTLNIYGGIKIISCPTGYLLSVAIYNKSDGTFVSRSGFNLTSYNSFDFNNYIYRFRLRKDPETTISLSDADNVNIEYIIDIRIIDEQVGKLEDSSGGYYILNWEIGNLNSSGKEIDSTTVIRSDFVEFGVGNVSVPYGYLMAVFTYNKITDTGSRSGFTYNSFDNFDFKTNKYRFCVRKNPETTISLTDAQNVSITAYYDNSIDNIDKKAVIPTNQLYDYQGDMPSASFEAYVKGGKFKEILSALTEVIIPYAQNDVINHDSTLIIYNGIAYIVYSANSTAVDNSSSQTNEVRLFVYDIANGTSNTYTVAKYQDSSGGHSMSGGAGQPNMVLSGNKLKIIFAANIDNKYQIAYREFDITNSNFGNLELVKFKGSKITSYSSLTVENLNIEFGKILNPSSYQSQQANSSIGYYDGYYYVGLVYGSGSGAGAIFKTSDLKKWDVFADYNDIYVKPFCELAVYADSTGIYSAVRPRNTRGTSATYGVFAKHDLSGNLVEYCYFKNSGSRPAFFVNNGTLMLVTNPYKRSNCDIAIIDTYEIKDSSLLLHFDESEFAYFSFANDGNNLYVAFTRSSKIVFKEIALPTITNYSILQKIMSLYS